MRRRAGSARWRDFRPSHYVDNRRTDPTQPRPVCRPRAEPQHRTSPKEQLPVLTPSASASGVDARIAVRDSPGTGTRPRAGAGVCGRTATGRWGADRRDRLRAPCPPTSLGWLRSTSREVGDLAGALRAPDPGGRPALSSRESPGDYLPSWVRDVRRSSAVTAVPGWAEMNTRGSSATSGVCAGQGLGCCDLKNRCGVTPTVGSNPTPSAETRS